MEHKRKKQWILIIVLLLTVCSVLAVYAGREWMFTNPFKPYTFSAVSYASADVDGMDYQILLEADFLVNADESQMSEAAIRHARETFFKTRTGTELLDSIFL